MSINPLLLAALLLASQWSFADAPPNNQMRRQQVEMASARLDQQMAACNTLKQRQISIEDPWLLQLSADDRNVVLFTLYSQAKQRCYRAEEEAYTLALVDLAVATGERSRLNEWLDLKQNDRPDPRAVTVLERLGRKELERLSALPKFHYPFDLMAVSE